VRTPLRHSRVYFVVYKTLCFLVFRTAGPLVALIVLNTRLICALKMARQRLKAANRRLRQTAQGHSRQRRRRTTNITLTLVVVVSVFIVCELPDLGLRRTTTSSRGRARRKHLGLRRTTYSKPSARWTETPRTAQCDCRHGVHVRPKPGRRQRPSTWKHRHQRSAGVQLFHQLHHLLSRRQEVPRHLVRHSAMSSQNRVASTTVPTNYSSLEPSFSRH